jgi:hypothetical protein
MFSDDALAAHMFQALHVRRDVLTRTRVRVWLVVSPLLIDARALAVEQFPRVFIKVSQLAYTLRTSRDSVAAALDWWTAQGVVHEHGRDSRGRRCLQLVEPHVR